MSAEAGRQHEHVANASPGHGRLLRILGVGFGLAVSIGNTIAAGIVRSPGEIAESIPDPVLIVGVWIAGGFYALAGANCLAELGTALPRAGAQYVFSRHALGEYPGFVVGWSDWLSNCGSAAAVALVIGEYTVHFLPSLAAGALPIALGVVLAFGLVQWHGLRSGRDTQNVASLVKTVCFVVLVGACFAYAGGSTREAIARPDARPDVSLVGLVFALQAVLFTYDGWAGPVYFSEEMEHSRRDLPRALFGGVIAIMAIYLSWNLALLRVLPVSEIAGNGFAMGTVAQRLFGGGGDTLVRVIMIVSMLASVNALLLMSTRVVFAMGRDGLFWRPAARVNAGGTPSVSLLLSVAVAVLFLLFSGTFKKLIDALAFFFVANYTASFISLFLLRAREPELPRPYRAWLHPWSTGLALAGSVVFLGAAIAVDLMGMTRSSLYALALLAVSYPAFRLVRRVARPSPAGYSGERND
jgi:APA family basic amino acid/polyamine antiporter